MPDMGPARRRTSPVIGSCSLNPKHRPHSCRDSMPRPSTARTNSRSSTSKEWYNAWCHPSGSNTASTRSMSTGRVADDSLEVIAAYSVAPGRSKPSAALRIRTMTDQSIPDADAADAQEQAEEVDTQPEPSSEAPRRLAIPVDADEADVTEQAMEVPLNDDER